MPRSSSPCSRSRGVAARRRRCRRGSRHVRRAGRRAAGALAAPPHRRAADRVQAAGVRAAPPPTARASSSARRPKSCTRFDARDGHMLWNHKLGGAVSGAAALRRRDEPRLRRLRRRRALRARRRDRRRALDLQDARANRLAAGVRRRLALLHQRREPRLRPRRAHGQVEVAVRPRGARDASPSAAIRRRWWSTGASTSASPTATWPAWARHRATSPGRARSPATPRASWMSTRRRSSTATRCSCRRTRAASTRSIPRTARPSWRFDVEGAGSVRAQGRRLYFTAAKAGLHALDLDGHLLWQQSLAEGGELSAPTLVDRYVLVSSARAAPTSPTRPSGGSTSIFFARPRRDVGADHRRAAGLRAVERRLLLRARAQQARNFRAWLLAARDDSASVDGGADGVASFSLPGAPAAPGAPRDRCRRRCAPAPRRRRRARSGPCR